LTAELVGARAYQPDDQGDVPGWRMNFSVLYNDDIVVSVNTKGMTPEQVFAMFGNID
jgi:hypothetical protein